MAASNKSREPVFFQTGGALAKVHPSRKTKLHLLSAQLIMLFSGPSFYRENASHLILHIRRTSRKRRELRWNSYFARDDKQDWYAASKTHCKSGHVVLKQADTRKFEGLQTNWRERGRIHGIIYRMAFGECEDRWRRFWNNRKPVQDSGGTPKKRVGVCGPPPKTLTLFMSSLQANLRPKSAIFPTLFMSY